MTQGTALPDLVRQTRESVGDEILNRFGNGLAIRTEVFTKADSLRILPLGTPQAALMNHMLHFPEAVRGKRVCEPFAGSGGIGFMALKVGASHLDLLDINPRAADFHRANAALNGFAAESFTTITGDIATFVPEAKADLLLANPPFVPTPDGIAGTITSNGGAEGNRFVEILLRRLEELVHADGRALVYLLQLARDGRPLVADLVAQLVRNRAVEVTPSQAHPTPLAKYCTAYSLLFPAAREAVEHWRADLIRRHGEALTICHYVADIGPRSPRPTECVLRDNFAEKFGDAFLVPSSDDDELALARAMENFVAS